MAALQADWSGVYDAGETAEEAAVLVRALVGDRRRDEVVRRAEGELAAAAEARAVFVAGEDAALRGRFMGEVGFRWEEAGTESVKLLAPAGGVADAGAWAGEQQAAMLSAESALGRSGSGKALAVYDLAAGNVAEACRLARGGRRVLASVEAGGAAEAAGLVGRGMREAGYGADDEAALVLYVGARVEAAWVRRRPARGRRKYKYMLSEGVKQ